MRGEHDMKCEKGRRYNEAKMFRRQTCHTGWDPTGQQMMPASLLLVVPSPSSWISLILVFDADAATADQTTREKRREIIYRWQHKRHKRYTHRVKRIFVPLFSSCFQQEKQKRQQKEASGRNEEEEKRSLLSMLSRWLISQLVQQQLVHRIYCFFLDTHTNSNERRKKKQHSNKTHTRQRCSFPSFLVFVSQAHQKSSWR